MISVLRGGVRPVIAINTLCREGLCLVPKSSYKQEAERASPCLLISLV